MAAGPHGQCLWISDTQISSRNAVSGSLSRREEGKVARGGCCTVRHPPVRSPHHQPSAWLLRREGVTSTRPCLARGGGAPDAAARMGKCAGPRALASRMPTREYFVGQRAWAAVEADADNVCARSLSLGVLQPSPHISSRSLGPALCTHPPDALAGLGALLQRTHISRAILACFPRMQCVVSAQVTSTRALGLSRVLLLCRHLPQECTLQYRL